MRLGRTNATRKPRPGKHTALTQAHKQTEQVQRPVETHPKVLKASSRLPAVDQSQVQMLPLQSLKPAKKERAHPLQEESQTSSPTRSSNSEELIHFGGRGSAVRRQGQPRSQP